MYVLNKKYTLNEQRLTMSIYGISFKTLSLKFKPSLTLIMYMYSNVVLYMYVHVYSRCLSDVFRL